MNREANIGGYNVRIYELKRGERVSDFFAERGLSLFTLDMLDINVWSVARRSDPIESDDMDAAGCEPDTVVMIQQILY